MPADWNRPAARLTQEFILALIDAAALEESLGLAGHAEHYLRLVTRLKQSAYKAFWSDDAGLLAETRKKREFQAST